MAAKKRIKKNAPKPETELQDLTIDRVDGVDRPANGSPFMILKAEDDNELRANAEKLADGALSALKALKGVALNKDAAEAIQSLADLLGVKLTVSEVPEETEKDEEAEQASADDKKEESTDDKETEATPAMSATDVKAAVAEGVQEAFKAMLKDEEPVSKSDDETPPASRQGDDNGAKRVEKKVGDGVFENIFFGQ